MVHACERPERFLKPRKFFQIAERQAQSVRKLLRSPRGREAGLSAPESMSNAERLSLLVIQLARHGKDQPVADAVKLAGHVEQLLHMLTAEVEAILVSQR